MGGIHQGLNGEGQLLPLGEESLRLLPLLRGQVALAQQRGIQQQIGRGGAGLAGDIGNEGTSPPPWLKIKPAKSVLSALGAQCSFTVERLQLAA